MATTPKVGPPRRGNAGKGRRAGSVNKTTREAKEAIEMAFQGIGGVNALIAWARDNQSAFFTSIYPKLLPVQHKVGGDATNPLTVNHVVRSIVHPDN